MFKGGDIERFSHLDGCSGGDGGLSRLARSPAEETGPKTCLEYWYNYPNQIPVFLWSYDLFLVLVGVFFLPAIAPGLRLAVGTKCKLFVKWDWSSSLTFFSKQEQ